LIHFEKQIFIKLEGPFFISLFTIFRIIPVLLMVFLWERIHLIVKVGGVLIVLMQNLFYFITSLFNPGLPIASDAKEVLRIKVGI